MKVVFTPVKVGDELLLGVQKFGKDGDPILVYKGFIIILKAHKGIEMDKMFKVRITKVLPKFAFAEIV